MSSIEDAREHALRGAWSLIDGDPVAAARELAQAATAAESLSVSARRELRDDRLWSGMPDDADDRWFRAATVAALAYQIGRAAHSISGERSRREQAALL